VFRDMFGVAWRPGTRCPTDMGDWVCCADACLGRRSMSPVVAGEGWTMDHGAPVRYASAGGVNIAYRVMGEGPLDLVWVPGGASNLDIDFESPSYVWASPETVEGC
jgi:hypothetical protein